MVDSRCGLSAEVLTKICAVFAGYHQIEMVILYGSRAKGNYTKGSDIDLALIGSDLDRITLNRIENELEDLLLPWTFDLSIYSQIQNRNLKDHIDRVGQVFFKRPVDGGASRDCGSPPSTIMPPI